MVFSRSSLNTLLVNNNYDKANKYAKEQLLEALNDVESLISCIQKCTNIVTYHMYEKHKFYKSQVTEKEAYLLEMSKLISIFVDSIKIPTGISIPDNVNGSDINKILQSSYQVSSQGVPNV